MEAGTKLSRICIESRGLSRNDQSKILELLDAPTIKRIEYETSYVYETYARILKESQPYDNLFCQRVNEKLDDTEYVKEINNHYKELLNQSGRFNM